MKRTATPCWRSAVTMRKSCRTSWAESEAVGSSMIRTRTSSEIALAISTVCCCGEGQAAGRLADVEMDVEPRQDLFGFALHAAPVDDLAPVAVTDEDVLRDREIGEDHRLLVDGRDAEPLRVLGRGDADRLTVDADLAGVLLLDAGHDLDQGRLAGAVFAEEGVDLAAIERQGDVLEGQSCAELLGNGDHFQHRAQLPRPGLLRR